MLLKRVDVEGLIKSMKWYQDPMTLATVIIAGAAVINLSASFLMWRVTRDYARTTRDIFEAAYRPHVSITGISPMNYPQEKKISFTVSLKNFGSIPARNVSLSCGVYNDGRSMDKSASVTEWALMPQDELTLTILIHDPEFYTFLDEGNYVTFFVTYVGAKNQTHKYVQVAKYKDRKVFLTSSSED